jgi:predicted transcriptional regulator
MRQTVQGSANRNRMVVNITGSDRGPRVGPMRTIASQGASLLEQDVRSRIFELVLLGEGASTNEIARRAGVAGTTAGYHLRKVRESGLLTPLSVGNRVVFSGNGAGMTAAERKARALLEHAPVRRLVEALIKNPCRSLRELSALCGLTLSGLYYHVNRLELHGLLRTSRDGRRIRYEVSALAVRALEPVCGTSSLAQSVVSASADGSASPVAA